MTITEGHPGLVALPERLDAIGRRVRAGYLLGTLTTAAALALIAFGFLEFASVSFGVPLDLAGRCAVAAILGIAVALLGAAADIGLWPGRVANARRADARLGLEERLATAVEVAEAADLENAPVARALLADAERRAGLIQPRSLAAIPWARSALILAAAAAFAAISLAPPDRYVAPPGGIVESAFTKLTAAEAAETEEGLRRVAAILERDAVARDDPFLEALAREAGRIGEEIEAGRLTDRDAVVAALDRLAGFTTEAYPPAVAPEVTSFEEPGLAMDRQPEATQILRDLVRERMTPPSATTDGAPRQDQPAVDPAGNTPADIPPMMGLPPPTADTANPQAPGGAEGDPPTGGGQAPTDDEGYIEAAAMETFNDPTNYAADQTAGERPEDAVPIGPADNANTGQSRFAGAGQGVLDGPPVTEDPFALGADMLLTGQLDETGRRIRIEVPPELQAIAVAPGEAVAGDWAPHREVTVARTTVPLAARDLLARYFRPTAEAE